MIAAYSEKGLGCQKGGLFSELYLFIIIQCASTYKHYLTSVFFLHVAFDQNFLK